MEKFSGFRDKDYLEQVLTLNEICDSKDPASLEGLVELLVEPIGDAAVDRMVVNAVGAVLSANEGATVDGLQSDNPKLKALCIQYCGESGFASAVPVLCSMAETESDPDVLMDVLNALGKIKSPDALGVFRGYLSSDDPYIEALAIEMIGHFKDQESVSYLASLVDAADEDDRYQQCDLETWKAVEALAEIADEPALSNLVYNLHHRNPTVRRIITDALVKVGEPAVPFLGDVFSVSTEDEKILAANILGFIGHKKGADYLVEAMDKGVVDTPNVKYAVYEALGRVGTMKGVICLMDGLGEDDELTLMAVVTGLDLHVNPGMVKALSKSLSKGDERAELLARSITSSKALGLFEALYPFEGVGELLVAELCKSKDPEILEEFRAKLEQIGSDRAKKHAGELPSVTTDEVRRRALAADDSKSMLGLYRAILTAMNFEPTVEPDGQAAFNHVELGERFDIVITDMNMPIMDGMQLVEKLRSTPGYETIPVIMVTTESEHSQRDMAEDTGVTAFLTKPFKPADLQELIQQYID